VESLDLGAQGLKLRPWHRAIVSALHGQIIANVLNRQRTHGRAVVQGLGLGHEGVKLCLTLGQCVEVGHL
jgi:hypothetical protein